ncbi:polyADP-ribose polymerase [Heterostelium album PN500]|uniref:PolyADP-ribose polymerase n=1 Tax=Heterostelium pallidum (strain ATCC 26659 / Pp 5 / PN500) TaxID=670386 RepID=D3B163_HETP5|nr:polyADP-ribose polymerase [Heterostelium album PN500]EFA85037.1 polyADP-ribose polymerase [Heterostelium album PN500]|eukprot:XP_020437147.1 polyADP-ribose polymerase [Heterostelium album PN500]
MGFQVKLKDYKKFEKKTEYLADILDHLKTSQLPTMVFKFKYDSSVAKNAEFDQLIEQFGSLFGYHGSSNDSWNNIIRGRGFANQYISEGCLFGHGFYFSSDSKVSHSFVKIGKWWDRSDFGGRVGCLSACEIVDTDQTHRGIKVSPQSSPKSKPLYQYTEDDKSLPDHYIVSKIGGHIRVKYLLIFQDQTNTMNLNLSSSSTSNNLSNQNNNQNHDNNTNHTINNNNNNNSVNRIKNLIPRQLNIFIVLFILYAIVLVIAGNPWIFSIGTQKKSFKKIVSKLEL